MAVGFAGDRFFVGNLGRLGIHVEFELAVHLREDDAKVHVADAADDQLVGLCVVMGLEARIAVGESTGGLGDLRFVAAGLGFDRQRIHRARKLRHRHLALGLVIEDGVADMQLQLGHREDIAGQAFVGLLVLVSLKLQQMARAYAFLLAGGRQIGIALEVTGKGTDEGVLDVALRFDSDLEDLSAEGAVGRQGFFLAADHEFSLLAVQRRGAALRDEVEELLDADVAQCVGVEHWDDLAAGDGLGQVGDHVINRQFALLEILVHQRVIDFRDALHDVLVALGYAAEVRLAVGAAHAIDDALATRRRQIDRR